MERKTKTIRLVARGQRRGVIPDAAGLSGDLIFLVFDSCFILFDGGFE